MLDLVRKVVVTGDVIMEWRLARSKIDKRKDAAVALLDPRSYIQASREPSGAVALAELIDAALPTGGGVRHVVLRRSIGDLEQYPVRGSFWNSYVLCAQYAVRKTDHENDGRAVWRVEKKLGLDRMSEGQYRKETASIEGDNGDAALVVVELAKQGFEERDAPWPLALTAPVGEPWLLVRWSRPQMYGKTPVWARFLEKFENRIAIVTSVDHLRLYGMRVSRGLSWERTVEELWQHISAAWDDSLAGCRHFIVAFLPAGAVVFTKTGGELSAKLVYDPVEIESSWAKDFEGEMMGYTRCLTAGIALEMLGASQHGTIEGHGIIAGMVASRQLLIQGFRPDETTGRDDTSLPKALYFPTGEVARALRDAFSYSVAVRHLTEADPATVKGGGASAVAEAAKFRVETVPASLASLANWRISDRKFESRQDILNRGRDVVERGSDDVRWDFPTMRIGKLFATARKEIENLRSVRDLLTDYLSSPAIAKPLSIAVFGKPGSGKSFAIKELAKDLATAKNSRPKLQDVTFNLSQFVGPESIVGALQRVRDIGLSGKLPLVFWDEFDASKTGDGALGWLRHFLAPMQDGQFQDGPLVHNVGRAVFVFAGGTSETLRVFKEHAQRHNAVAGGTSVFDSEEYGWDDDDDDDTDPTDEISTFRRTAKNAKVPDFLSRLRGFVNIPSLNHRGRRNVSGEQRLDAAVVFRRAELLRSFLLDSPGDLVRIVRQGDVVRKHINADVGLVNGFLAVRQFRYGARSLEAIVKMSGLAGKQMYDRSSLPPKDQLSLHVSDVEDFIREIDRHKGSSPRPR
jgi:KAP family P-loop domain